MSEINTGELAETGTGSNIVSAGSGFLGRKVTKTDFWARPYIGPPFPPVLGPRYPLEPRYVVSGFDAVATILGVSRYTQIGAPVIQAIPVTVVNFDFRVRDPENKAMHPDESDPPIDAVTVLCIHGLTGLGTGVPRPSGHDPLKILIVNNGYIALSQGDFSHPS